MPITERTLRKWRKEALIENCKLTNFDINQEWANRVLRMTQELLDAHLLRRVK